MAKMPYSARFFGTSAAVPSVNRGFSCIGLINKKEENTKQSGQEEIMLLDCGDGSIRKIMETGTSSLAISNILITHFHSDHLSGLAQIIETMSIEGRTQRLDIYGLPGLEEYFSTVQKTTNVAINRHFDLSFLELEQGQKVSLGEYEITPYSMQHAIPCLGYRVEHSDFVLCYTGDTEPCENILSLAKDVDLLIHEATYLNRDLAKARETKHSTPSEASEMASKAGARNLVLTHINDRRETENEMIEEVAPTYPKTMIAHDGFEVNL
jgi:ribonuclease Z